MIHGESSKKRKIIFLSQIIMSEEISRRQFLKETVDTTASLSVAFCIGQGINLKETVQCNNCGAVNIYTRSYLSCLTSHKEIGYCHDCGTNLKTLKHDITCHDYCYCSKKNLNSKNRCDLPECCQIPFPNHKCLKKSRTPDFSLKDFKF